VPDPFVEHEDTTKGDEIQRTIVGSGAQKKTAGPERPAGLFF